MADSGAARKHAQHAHADPMAKFLAYLEEIERALLRRDAMGVTALLRKRTATHLPREVREELLYLSGAPRESLRAPVQFLRFQHRMTQLALGGEPLPTAQIELRLEPPPSAGVIRLREHDDRRAAAGDAGDVGRVRDATDERTGECDG